MCRFLKVSPAEINPNGVELINLNLVTKIAKSGEGQTKVWIMGDNAPSVLRISYGEIVAILKDSGLMLE